jgi:hypothetical protein
MTREDTQEILKILGTSFPQFGDMVHALRYPAETMRTYREALQQVPFLTAKEVIADWASGKVAPPAAYERDQTVAKLCRECRDRQEKTFRKESAQESLKTWHQESAKAEQRRKEYKPLRVRGLGWASTQFAELVDSICKTTGRPRSQWTDEDQAEYDRQMKAIIEQYENPNATEPADANPF